MRFECKTCHGDHPTLLHPEPIVPRRVKINCPSCGEFETVQRIKCMQCPRCGSYVFVFAILKEAV